MSEGDTPEEGLQKGTKATDEYLKSQIHTNPGESGSAETKDAEGVSSEAGTTEGEQLYAGRYKTVEDLESGYKHWQSQHDKLKPLAERAEQFQSFLQEAETNPAFREHVMGYFDDSTGKSPDSAAAISARPKLDEYGTPTGEIELDESALAEHVERIAEQKAQQMAQAQAQESDMKRQLDALQSKHGLTPDQMQEFVQHINTPGAITIANLWDAYSGASTETGRQEVLQKIRDVSSEAPPTGIVPGEVEPPKDITEEMADDILRVGGKSDLERELGI